ncbi:MAG: hypothetical protein AAGJ31_00510 [Verrucomicrobiota bacterium]
MTKEVLTPDQLRFCWEEFSIEEFFQRLQDEEPFRWDFQEVLRGVPFEGFFFETPPATRFSWSERAFECVVVNGPQLVTLTQDERAFADQFHRAKGDLVCHFPNLGGDAHLIAPCPSPGYEGYAHLASFLRDSSRAQVSAFWKMVGTLFLEQVGESPCWLSTAGMGVSWLHLRLDSRPKYYRYGPYKTLPS